MSTELAPIVLMNGVTLRFLDQSNRYYGDFHRICIKVQMFLPTGTEMPAGLNRETACFERTLEKMGVVSATLEEEKDKLLQRFLATSQTYLQKEQFPAQLLRQIAQQKKRPTLVFIN